MAFSQSVLGFSPQVYVGQYATLSQPAEKRPQYGQGVYMAPQTIVVYEAPQEGSPIIEQFQWSNAAATAFSQVSRVYSQYQKRYVPASQVFLAFYPASGLALMAVVGDQGEISTPTGPQPQWLEVVIDQHNKDQHSKKTGWVHCFENTKLENAKPVFLPWLQFMKINAKAYGIRWLQGVPSYYRSLHSSNSDDATLINTTMIRRLTVQHVRGNWLLVEAIDFQRNAPIGWVRWRDDEGQLLVFPNFTGQKTPVLSAGL